MKKNLLFFLLLYNIQFINALPMKNIDKWIIGFPEKENSIIDYSISNFTSEEAGIFLELKKKQSTLKISIIKQISFTDFINKIKFIDEKILFPANLNSEKWEIIIKTAEISFGLNGDINIGLNIDSYKIKLNEKTALQLKNKISGEPVFSSLDDSNSYSYFLQFYKITLDTGNKDKFSGWNNFNNKLITWFDNGVLRNDKEVLALILETKIMNAIEAQEEKKLILPKKEKSNFWLGCSIDYIASNFISGESKGVYFNPFLYNLVGILIDFNIKSIGRKQWLFKPFQIKLSVGGFFEVNLSYESRKANGEFLKYDTTNGSFFFAGGPSISLGFSSVFPKIIEGKPAMDIFGIGIEFISMINIPYFFKDFYYEYFFNQYIIFILHFIPFSIVRPEFLIGMNLAFANLNFDESNNVITLSKFSFDIGLRLKIDIYNF